MLSKRYKYIDRDARRGWDRELKEPACAGHRRDRGGDDTEQEWARVMSGQLLSLC